MTIVIEEHEDWDESLYHCHTFTTQPCFATHGETDQQRPNRMVATELPPMLPHWAVRRQVCIETHARSACLGLAPTWIERNEIPEAFK